MMSVLCSYGDFLDMRHVSTRMCHISIPHFEAKHRSTDLVQLASLQLFLAWVVCDYQIA